MTDSLPIGADLTTTAEDEKAEVVITYDIQDDERRGNARAICSEHGRWVQRSVFEFTVTEEQYQKLLQSLLRIINEEEDHMRAYLLAHPTGETAAEWGTPKGIRELKSKIEGLSEEERRKVLQSIE